MSGIYLDHAATTATLPEVVDAMKPYYTKEFYNPSSAYQPSQEAKRKLEEVRESIASVIGAESEEIYFTSGGTEADNWALTMLAKRQNQKWGHIITSAIEHHAVGHTCRRIEQQGGSVTYVPVDARGLVHVRDVRTAMNGRTAILSIMYANNEIGTIQPIHELGMLAKEYGIPFHTDAVQACGQVPINVKKDGISMLSASAHKFQGPKGVGFLYVQKDLPIHRLLEGGGQERGFRAGTENVPGIVGMGKALELAAASMEQRQKQESYLRDYMMQRITKEIPYSRINGHRWFRLPNHVSAAFRFVNSASLLVMLDMEHIYASGGSACNTGSAERSHVIQAIGIPKEYQDGVIRFTLGMENTKKEIDYTVDRLKEAVAELRKQSPEYEDYRKNEIDNAKP